MFLIIGIVIVLACVIGGFLMIQGPLDVLMQPSEFVVIGGAAIGAMLAANPLKLLKLLVAKIPVALKGSPYNKVTYSELLRLQYEVFINAKKGGLLSIEEDEITHPPNLRSPFKVSEVSGATPRINRQS